MRSLVCACGVLILFCSAAQAGSTVIQFSQTNPADIVTATDTAGVTTLSTAGNADGAGLSIAVTISNFLGVPGLAIPAFETFVGVTSTAAAVSVSGQVFQSFTGTIEVTSGPGGLGTNFLTATFTDTSAAGVLGGTLGGTQAQLTATGPPQSLLLTSDFATLTAPTSMTMGFSNVTPPFGIAADGSIASFTAQNTGTFGATITPIPEPATLGMGCMALAFVSLAVRCNRRFRRKPAEA